MPEHIDFSTLNRINLDHQQHAEFHGVPKPVSFDEAWALIHEGNQLITETHEQNQVSIQELIEQAKIKLASGATKAADLDNLPTVEAVDKATVKQLHALANEAKIKRDEADAEYNAIKQVLKDMLGSEDTAAEVLTVNGAPVATWKKSSTTILNQAAIKARFPRDLYPELYTEQERRTFLLK